MILLMINRFENFRYTDSPLTKEDRNGEYMTYGSKKLLKMRKNGSRKLFRIYQKLNTNIL